MWATVIVGFSRDSGMDWGFAKITSLQIKSSFVNNPSKKNKSRFSFPQNPDVYFKYNNFFVLIYSIFTSFEFLFRWKFWVFPYSWIKKIPFICTIFFSRITMKTIVKEQLLNENLSFTNTFSRLSIEL
jgi:hypothetical protein